MGTETNPYSWTQSGYEVQNLDVIGVLQPCLLYNDIKTGKILCFKTKLLGQFFRRTAQQRDLDCASDSLFQPSPRKGAGCFHRRREESVFLWIGAHPLRTFYLYLFFYFLDNPPKHLYPSCRNYTNWRSYRKFLFGGLNNFIR